jgi:hypothetical protein
MAEEKKEKGKLSYLSISVVENGYKLEAQYSYEPTLSQRAGWVDSSPSYCAGKCYVEKTKDAVLKRLKEIL